MTDDKGVPGYQGRLNDSCVTIAEVLRPAGYFTAMSGKWHVGQNYGVTPWGRGFDRSLNAAAGWFYFPEAAKAKLFLNGEAIANDDPRLPKNWYSTDLWTTFGLKFIDEALAAKKPFYQHLCHNAPHFPLQAPAEEITKFRGKYMIGWGGRRVIAAMPNSKSWASSTRSGPKRRVRLPCSLWRRCLRKSKTASITSWPPMPPSFIAWTRPSAISWPV